MRRSFTLLGCVALGVILLLSSCEKDKDKQPNSGQSHTTPTPSIEEPQIPVNLSFGVLASQTKVTDNAFENGDKVGLYMSYGDLQNAGNHINNQLYSLSSGAWNTDTEVFWKDNTTSADFYAYCPYGSPAYVAEYEFNVNSDQSSMPLYKGSDFLWGRSMSVRPSKDLIGISMSHILSTFIVVLKPGEGFTADEFAAASKSVTFCSLKNTARIDLASGAVTAAGEPSQITPYNTGEEFRAIVVPQATSTLNPLLSIMVAGVNFSLSQNITFLTKTQHKLTVQVDKTLAGISLTIDGWNTDPNDYTGIAK